MFLSIKTDDIFLFHRQLQKASTIVVEAFCNLFKIYTFHQFVN